MTSEILQGACLLAFDVARDDVDSGYPVEPEVMNLRVISAYRERFPEIIVGLSDHQSVIQTQCRSSLVRMCRPPKR